MTEFKIAVMDGVRGYTERCPVELWINESGRVVVRSFHEGGNNYTDVDLHDVLNWISLVQGWGYCLMVPETSPLEEILAEIDKALEAGFYYLAVSTVLTLPDICVSLTSEDGRSTGPLYRQWCDDNLGEEFGFVTGDDLWSFRCGVVHNGRFGDLKHDVERVVFSLPFRGFQIVNNRFDDAYVYGAVEFCRNFMDVVRSWYDANKNDDNLKRNIERMVQYRPDGLEPYIKGMPLLA